MTPSTDAAWHGRITAITSPVIRNFIMPATWISNMYCPNWRIDKHLTEKFCAEWHNSGSGLSGLGIAGKYICGT
jgi:hypothetical protein